MPSKEYEVILEVLNSRQDTSGLSFEERRSNFEMEASQLPVAENVSCEPLSIDNIPAEWIVPAKASRRGVLLYLHGGGYCVGSIDTHRGMVSHIASESGTKALLIDYRLAPEHPFPAAVEDSTTAYKWLLSQGTASDDIIIAGDSAGGGLAVSTLISLKEKEIPLPAAAVLLSPWVDLAMTGDSITSKADIDPLVTKESLFEMAEAYLGETDGLVPLASPVYAALKGLPPMLIHVGTSEVLHDDAARLADLAVKSGVEVSLNVAEGMCHVWHYFTVMLPESIAAIKEIAVFMREHLGI